MTMTDFLNKSSAIISPCGMFRYELRRRWESTYDRPFVLCMLNPSTADHEKDDMTITLSVKRAKHYQCNELIVCNLGAFRATRPDVWKAAKDPIGPESDAHIRRIFKECKERDGIAVAAWGSHGSFRNRSAQVLTFAGLINLRLWCLGFTEAGYPRHPLYVPGSQPLAPFAEH